MANQKYEAFLKVAETGSFKQAALELGYTQAGVSYLVSALERELDLPLFVRDYGGARLTADGAELLPWVRSVRADERRLETRVAELKHLASGVVRVGAFTSTAIQWFPGMAKSFLAQYPGIDLQLLCLDDQDELEGAVWRGDADCGFFVFPIKRDLHAVPLRHDPLLVVLPPDHPLADAPFVPREALAAEPYIRLKSGTSSEMESLFRNNGVEPSVRFTIDSDYAVMSMVSAGLGFSVLSGLILRDAPFPLAIVPPEVETSREIALALRSRETASTATRAFAEHAERWIAATYGA
ncbi:LysR family transcriptional regulator [Gordonibacter sp. An232A]|mgnify:FL=1|uniref:LysR family transcriptional regulator n=1 Tax=Rubneribacter badeniensis TaxID=2070688 RepID=A0A9D3AC57_9ACTN|nr:LysR family transcriptional regulator [Gordonibacter sp. An232A]HJH42975.1 LysR family transcriptional regulator [Rubneribacter badeniensis]